MEKDLDRISEKQIETDNELREIKKTLARMDKKGTHPFSLSMH
ncbi:MAG: hypothetical protein YK1309IOTA_810004 [Marine Group I thaumarchaeote]|nr:MAG: hypothetical protein YK1309IOTA_810004 [Marine Group I thaumarchaeote]